MRAKDVIRLAGQLHVQILHHTDGWWYYHALSGEWKRLGKTHTQAYNELKKLEDLAREIIKTIL